METLYHYRHLLTLEKELGEIMLQAVNDVSALEEKRAKEKDPGTIDILKKQINDRSHLHDQAQNERWNIIQSIKVLERASEIIHRLSKGEDCAKNYKIENYLRRPVEYI